MQHIFIIGSKGIPAAYGGFETFVEKSTQYQKSLDIKYHVACAGDENREFEYNHAHCFRLRIPKIASVKAVYYDLAALKYCIAYIRKNQIKNAVIYILVCRIGPFIGGYKKKIQQLGGHLYVNPDGSRWA